MCHHQRLHYVFYIFYCWIKLTKRENVFLILFKLSKLFVYVFKINKAVLFDLIFLLNCVEVE